MNGDSEINKSNGNPEAIIPEKCFSVFSPMGDDVVLKPREVTAILTKFTGAAPNGNCTSEVGTEGNSFSVGFYLEQTTLDRIDHLCTTINNGGEKMIISREDAVRWLFDETHGENGVNVSFEPKKGRYPHITLEPNHRLTVSVKPPEGMGFNRNLEDALAKLSTLVFGEDSQTEKN
ncbi:hypothetical protein DYH10_02950 [Candidatus Saccharibacteria bacterium CPR2]|nr:hypothetical protein [Candidatus Saccharibacteria bacterium CPR2]